MPYAELHCLSNFSFLRGASRPEELVLKAAELGYEAIALTDECSYAGIVKAHVAARELSMKLIVGSEFTLEDREQPDNPVKLVLLAPDRAAYSEISALISRARRRSPKGEYKLYLQELQFGTRHCLAIWLPVRDGGRAENQGALLKRFFRDRVWLGVELLQQEDDRGHYLWCGQLSAALDISMTACNNVHMHSEKRKPLQDVLTAIRLNIPVQKLGTRRQGNGECHLRAIPQLAAIYPRHLLEEARRIAGLCHFSLDELRYEYPEEVVPEGQSPREYLARLTIEGATRRWPRGVPPQVREQLDRELALIAELRYEYYFLTVHDIVRFAREQGILCQGRGSAANSAVCYCLFITEVDPARSDLLFERFISRERNEPPDIDVDFEHERREEVIQYIYNKYTRKRAALAATVITYRPRSAVRDVGKALGMDPVFVDRLARTLTWWEKPKDLEERLREANIDANSRLGHQFLYLLNEILGFPRHLSQHVGGFVITHSPISTLVPVENAAMAERTVVQWDKEDIEAMGLLKVDVLALGMLTAMRKCFRLIGDHYGAQVDMAAIPAEDPKTYDMLCRGDSIGVFQVESRAQMSMLPRLKPRTFYDLVIEVAIVRPGPIQGDMVHPFLKRRQGIEKITYPNEEIRSVLKRTLGVPIFQEQVIKLAMVAAGFSGGEADRLRRAMASWGRNGNLLMFERKVIDGMLARGYSLDFARRLFNQMKGFGDYGFPESHAASFALLAYASAWLKRHYPAAFYCALLNSQPMGFYSPSQLVQDAKRHHITVLPVTVAHSHWESTLEASGGRDSTVESQPALRLGMQRVRGFNREAAERLLAARRQQSFANMQDLARRARLNRAELDALVSANALQYLGGHRHQARWQALAVEAEKPLLEPWERSNPRRLDDRVALPAPTEAENLVEDYQSTGLTLNRHPMALLRRQSPFDRCRRAADLPRLNSGRFVRIAGLVTGRQRPGTATGVLFMTLEDETGNINVVIWKDLQLRFRQAVIKSQLVLVKGIMESRDNVIHVIAGEVVDYSHVLPALVTKSRDFH